MQNKSKKTENTVRFMTCSGMTAALYILFTELSAMLGLSGGVIQIRFSEALTVLPALLPASPAVFGLFSGCILANLLTGCAPWDVIFGSLATLIGAIGTYFLRRHPRLLWLPPVLANMLIVPHVLILVYGAEKALWFLTLTVGTGEVISCGGLGMLLYHTVGKRLKK